MQTITVAQQLVTTLKELGVKHVFGVPSGGWTDYMEAIRTTEGIDFVLTSHEGGAAFMAEVCGRLTGTPGVCFGTFGPGATNLATGVGGALLDRSPMIALTDEMPAEKRGRRVQMGIDHQALFRPLTKRTMRLDADAVQSTLYEAANIALSDVPGPVHIGLPTGLSGLPAKAGNRIQEQPQKRGRACSEQLDKLALLFSRAQKPVLVPGLRAARAGIGPLLLKVLDKFSIPVVLTPMAKGLVPENHPCYAGVLFHALSDIVAQTHQQADLVVSIGYDEVEFSYEEWLNDAPLVHVDIRPCELDAQHAHLAVDVIGDIAMTLERLLHCDGDKKNWDLNALGNRKQQMFAMMSKPSSVFGPCAALDILRERLPRDGIMTCDVGAHTHLIGQKWLTPAPGLQIMTNGWSAMGYGIPAAIAAKLCYPQKAVCAVLGDGGFLMTAGELAVAVRLQLHIVFVLFSDNDLALIRIKQQRKHHAVYGTPVREQSHVGGDNLFGVPLIRATDAEHYAEALTRAFAMTGPVIVEAMLDSREYDSLVLHKDRA